MPFLMIAGGAGGTRRRLMRKDESSRKEAIAMTDLGGLLILFLDLLAIISLLTGNTSVGHKVVWILVILLLPILGVLLYVLIGREPHNRHIGNFHTGTR